VIKENKNMNRLLIAACALSLSAFGCAAGTDDPEQEPVTQEPQRDPPKQVRSGIFTNPYDQIQVPLDSYKLLPDEEQLQEPNIPSR
jgi:hypothetical protein